MKPAAAAQDVAEFAAHLDPQALDCRARGHRWESHRVTWDRRTKTYDEQEVCACDSTRHTVYDDEGFIQSRTIGYPSDGYLAPRGMGRLTMSGRAAIRRERLSRARPTRASRKITPITQRLTG